MVFDVYSFLISFFIMLALFFSLLHLVAYLRNRLLRNAVLSGLFLGLLIVFLFTIVLHIKSPLYSKNFFLVLLLLLLSGGSMIALIIYTFIPLFRLQKGNS